MRRPVIVDTHVHAEPEGLALTLTVGNHPESPTGFTFRATPDALEALQVEIQAALAGKYDPPEHV